MRLSILTVILFCSFLAISQSKNERITLSFESAELPTIFDSLSQKTGYFFSYNSDLLPKGSKYSITAIDQPIDQFLSSLLVGTNLKYTFFKEQIIINYEEPKEDTKRRKMFNISGRVLDENGEPLNGVNVFLDGTTIGTSTDIDGNYRIEKIPPGYYDLVFSYIGYENAVYSLSEYNGGSRIQRHNMVQEVSLLEEVEIVADRITKSYDHWTGYFQLFQNDLFGTSENARHCVITNPEVIDFTYDQSTKKLKAFAKQPIIIRNDAMAYMITYYLESFERTDNDLRYRGQIRFQNNFVEDNGFSKREIRMERKKSYYGSWNHFKKSLLASRLKNDGFKIFETKNFSPINTKKLEPKSEGDIVIFKGNHWELEFKDHLVIVYGKERESVNFLLDGQFSSVIYDDLFTGDLLVRSPGKQISLLKLLHGPVRLDLNGQVVDRFALTSFGYWSWERLANLVPINYDPKFDNF